jgi:murein DD-endopeptidase MepM/ murein hydrolase activator NlpD
MDQDRRIVAEFIALLPSVSMNIANTTPQTIADGSFSLSFLATRGWRNLVEMTRDFKAWTPIALITKDVDANVDLNFLLDKGQQIEAYRKTPIAPDDDEPFLNFPLEGGSSTSTKVFAMIDHHAGKDGVFRTLTGKTMSLHDNSGYGRRYVKQNQSAAVSTDTKSEDYFGKYALIGFIQDSVGSDLSLPFNYEDDDAFTPGSKGIIWYDGHTGYDFAASSTDRILSAATGRLIVEDSKGCYNQIVLGHGVDETYRTYYLHCSKWDPALDAAYAANNRSFTVEAGHYIGNPGNEDCDFAVPVHLHFTVKRKKWESRSKPILDLRDSDYVVVDPYGDRPCPTCDNDQPFLWLPGQ